MGFFVAFPGIADVLHFAFFFTSFRIPGLKLGTTFWAILLCSILAEIAWPWRAWLEFLLHDACNEKSGWHDACS